MFLRLQRVNKHFVALNAPFFFGKRYFPCLALADASRESALYVYDVSAVVATRDTRPIKYLLIVV